MVNSAVLFSRRDANETFSKMFNLQHFSAMMHCLVLPIITTVVKLLSDFRDICIKFARFLYRAICSSLQSFFVVENGFCQIYMNLMLLHYYALILAIVVHIFLKSYVVFAVYVLSVPVFYLFLCSTCLCVLFMQTLYCCHCSCQY